MNALQALSGGCLCGKVRYLAQGRLNAGYACHCLDCQTRSGSAFAMMLPVASQHLTVTGVPRIWEQTLPSGEKASTFACDHCLTRVFTRRAAWDGISVLRAGTLDRSRELVPRLHLWTRSAQRWLVIPEGVPSFETQPTSRADWLALLGKP